MERPTESPDVPPHEKWARKWALLDSNQGRAGYEPAALTAELRAPTEKSMGRMGPWVYGRFGATLPDRTHALHEPVTFLRSAFEKRA